MARVLPNQLGFQIIHHHVVIKGYPNHVHQLLAVQIGPNRCALSSFHCVSSPSEFLAEQGLADGLLAGGSDAFPSLNPPRFGDAAPSVPRIIGDLLHDTQIHEAFEGSNDAQHLGLVIGDDLANRPGVALLFQKFHVNASFALVTSGAGHDLAVVGLQLTVDHLIHPGHMPTIHVKADVVIIADVVHGAADILGGLPQLTVLVDLIGVDNMDNHDFFNRKAEFGSD